MACAEFVEGGWSVTLFRRSNDIEVSTSSAFDKEYKPGEAPSHSGIYRCRGCGCEIIGEAFEPLPLENHPKHRRPKGQFDGDWLSPRSQPPTRAECDEMEPHAVPSHRIRAHRRCVLQEA